MSRIVFDQTRDEPEAKGRVWLEKSVYGYFLFVEGINVVEGAEEPVALIDLFYASPEGANNPYSPVRDVDFAMSIHGEWDDPVAHVYWKRNGENVIVQDSNGRTRIDEDFSDIL